MGNTINPASSTPVTTGTDPAGEVEQTERGSPAETTTSRRAQPHGNESFERTGGTGRVESRDPLDRGAHGVSVGGSAGTTTTGRTGGTNLQAAQATAEHLADAYFEPGFDNVLLEALRGKTNAQQRHILARFNPLAKAALMRRTPHPATRMIIEQNVRSDHTFLARRELSDDSEAVLDAYLDNASGRLEPHNQLHLSIKGMGTFEGGVFDVYRGKSAGEIRQMETDYQNTYDESVEDALEGGLFKELNATDRATWETLRLGRENLTPAHYAALEVHNHSAAVTGTHDSEVFRVLSEQPNYQDVAAAYREIFDTDMTAMLENELDDFFAHDGNELARLRSLTQNNPTAYLIHTIEGGEADDADLAEALLTLVDGGKVSAETLRSHDNGALLQALDDTGDRRLQGIATLLRRGEDLVDSPGARAVHLMAAGIEGGGPEDTMVLMSDLIASIPPEQRGEVAQAFERLYGRSLESHVRSHVREMPIIMGPGGNPQPAMELAERITSERVDRLMHEWTFGRSSESVMIAYREGVASPEEALAALRAVPPGQRAEYAGAFDAEHGDGAFDAILDKLPKKANKAAKLEMKLDEVARATDLHHVEELVHHIIEDQRFATTLETRVSASLMDTFGQTGVLLDESARGFFATIHELADEAEQHGELTPDQQERLQAEFTQFTRLYTEYLGEKEDIAYSAGTAASIAAAVAVSTMTAGTAAPILYGALAGGAAKVTVKNTVMGTDYSLLSWKAAGDFAKAAAIEYGAGKIAHFAHHALAQAPLSLASRAGTRGITRYLVRGGESLAVRLESRAVAIGMDTGMATGANAGFGNFRSLGTSERVSNPGS